MSYLDFQVYDLNYWQDKIILPEGAKPPQGYAYLFSVTPNTGYNPITEITAIKTDSNLNTIFEEKITDRYKTRNQTYDVYEPIKYKDVQIISIGISEVIKNHLVMIPTNRITANLKSPTARILENTLRINGGPKPLTLAIEKDVIKAVFEQDTGRANVMVDVEIEISRGL